MRASRRSLERAASEQAGMRSREARKDIDEAVEGVEQQVAPSVIQYHQGCRLQTGQGVRGPAPQGGDLYFFWLLACQREQCPGSGQLGILGGPIIPASSEEKIRCHWLGYWSPPNCSVHGSVFPSH